MMRRRTREAATADMRSSAKMRASSHATEMRASTHTADMGSRHAAAHATGAAATTHATASYAAGMPATTHTATAHATATAAHASERRGRSSKRGAKRGRHDAPENLVAHPNYSVVEAQRHKSPHKSKQPTEPNDPAMTNYKCDSF
jgi:hypothetical protein